MIKKHIILGILVIIGLSLFIALCGEIEGSLGKIIITKVLLAVGLYLTVCIGKILKNNDLLPDIDE